MGKLKDETFLLEKISDSIKIRELSLLEPTQINNFNFEDVFSGKTQMNLKEFQEIASKITTGYQLPWIIIKKLVNEGLTNKNIEILNSEIWPCNKEDAVNVEIKKHEVAKGEKPQQSTITIDPFFSSTSQQSKTVRATSEFKDFELQDMVEVIPKLKEIAPNLEFKFNLSIHCVCSDEDLINKLNDLLKDYNKNFQFYR